MQIEIIVPSLIPQSQQMGSSRGFLCRVPLSASSARGYFGITYSRECRQGTEFGRLRAHLQESVQNK